jgi:predicted nucleic acid-binding protein
MNKLRAVIDTNVVFEGLTKRGGAAGILIEAWLAELIDVRVSNALAYEYISVLSRKLSEKRWRRIEPVLGTLLAQAEFVVINYTWRPVSPDPQDDHVIDCAMNTGAVVITSNIRDFRTPEKRLGLPVLTPAEAVLVLVEREE